MEKILKKYVWLFGFFALFGIKYFYTNELSDLFMFSFAGFFGFYFTNRIQSDIADEMYVENMQKAKSVASTIPTIVLFIIGFGLSIGVLNSLSAVLITVIGWNVTLITYAVLFYYFEKY